MWFIWLLVVVVYVCIQHDKNIVKDDSTNGYKRPTLDEYMYEVPSICNTYNIVGFFVSCFGVLAFFINFIVAIILCIIGIGFFIYSQIVKNNDRSEYDMFVRMVKSGSSRYKDLVKLWNDHNFDSINYNDGFKYDCKNAQRCRYFNYDEHLINYLKRNSEYKDYIDASIDYDKYLSELFDTSGKTSPERFEKLWPNKLSLYSKFKVYEDMMCEYYTLSLSDTYNFTITTYYYTPSTHIYRERYSTYSFDTIISICKAIDNNKFNDIVIKPSKMYVDTISDSDVSVVNYPNRKRTVGTKQRQRILRRDNFTCCMCGAKGPAAGGNAVLHVDHIRPFSKGGSDNDDNLWTLCADCNLGKSNDWDDTELVNKLRNRINQSNDTVLSNVSKQLVSVSYDEVVEQSRMIEQNNVDETQYNMVSNVSNGDKIDGWIWFIGKDFNKLKSEVCGKWICNFNNSNFAVDICNKAVELGVCYACKCTDAEIVTSKPYIACFYLNGNNASNHRRLIMFMLENNLIQKSNAGKFYNISFSFDNCSIVGQYGSDSKGKIYLNQFIDLSTGVFKL